MDDNWNLHLFRGVIEDGTPERRLGEIFTWDVCFWSERILSRATLTTRSAVLTQNNFYRVNAEIINVSREHGKEYCVLDFGILAISESGTVLGLPLPPECRVGDYVAGTVRLELPLCTEIQPHNISRRWRINRIHADMTDFSSYPGDLGKVSYWEIPDTAAVNPGSYVLNCTDLGIA